MRPDPQSLLEAYAAAVYARDVAAFVKLYAPDIRMFDSWDHWEARGLESLRAATAEWFASLGEERVRVTFQEMSHSQSEQLAALHGFVTFQAIAADGTPLRAMRERVSWVLEKREGGWLVTHQHTSLPADFATGKVMKD